MTKTLAQSRQIKNEVVFRQANESVQKGLDEIKKMAKKEGYTGLPKDDDIPLHFFCECSDENCKERIVLKPSEYKAMHTNRRQFLIKPVHEVPAIEKVVSEKANYTVVKKHDTPPETASKLQITDTDNV